MALLSRMEKVLRQNGHTMIIGVDEAGRGPWAGPVVAAAVWLPEKMRNRACQEELLRINDSKKVNSTKRLSLFDFICAEGKVGIGIKSAYWVDRLNILGATFRAMCQAIQKLAQNLETPIEYVLVDGNLEIPDLGCSQRTIVRGDAAERLIAAASIVAKVTRDRLMLKYDQAYPQYGFASHKGYGTMKHRENLKRFGPCPLHRKSFKMNYLAAS